MWNIFQLLTLKSQIAILWFIQTSMEPFVTSLCFIICSIGVFQELGHHLIQTADQGNLCVYSPSCEKNCPHSSIFHFLILKMLNLQSPLMRSYILWLSKAFDKMFARSAQSTCVSLEKLESAACKIRWRRPVLPIIYVVVLMGPCTFFLTYGTVVTACVCLLWASSWTNLHFLSFPATQLVHKGSLAGAE